MCTAEVEAVLVQAGQRCNRDNCSLTPIGSDRRHAPLLLDCADEIWNATVDSEHPNSLTTGARAIMEAALDCADEPTYPTECTETLQCTNWRVACGMASLSDAAALELSGGSFSCTPKCADAFLSWYEACHSDTTALDDYPGGILTMAGLDEMNYKCKAVAKREWKALELPTFCTAPLQSCDADPTGRCPNQILEHWEDEFRFPSCATDADCPDVRRLSGRCRSGKCEQDVRFLETSTQDVLDCSCPGGTYTVGCDAGRVIPDDDGLQRAVRQVADEAENAFDEAVEDAAQHLDELAAMPDPEPEPEP